MLKKFARVLAVVLTVLVIVLSIGGIVGVWYLNNVAANVTRTTFAVVQTGVNVIDGGVARVENLVATGRAEVQQAEETIVTVAGNVQANRPVLTALNERLETRLGPTVDQLRTTIEPIRDTVIKVASIVDIAASLPFAEQRTPRLIALDQAFDRLAEVAADIQQLRTTLRETVLGEIDQFNEQTVTALTTVTTRIDTRLAETQANIEETQAEIQALRDRLDAQQQRLLLIYNLVALATTLLFLWVIYSQVVVMQHHWRLLRSPAAAVSGPASAQVAPASPAAVPASAPAAATAVMPAVTPAPAEEVEAAVMTESTAEPGIVAEEEPSEDPALADSAVGAGPENPAGSENP